MPLNKRELQSVYDRSVLGPEYTKAIKEYDPDLDIYWNRLEDRYEIFREEWDEGRQAVIHVPIAKGPPGKTRVDMAQVINRLRAIDTRVRGQSHTELIDKYLREQEKDQEDREERLYEAVRPAHERLAWQVAKETGNLATFVGYTPPPKV